MDPLSDRAITIRDHRTRGTVKASKICPAALAVVIMAFALSGCASHPKASGAAAYKSALALIRALGDHEIACTRVHVVSSPPQPGALSVADCTANSDGDTAVGTFTDHASAMAAAGRELTTRPHGAPCVVGANWLVSTDPTVASRVRAALGGQLLTSENIAAAHTKAPPLLAGPVTQVVPPQRVSFIVTGSAPGGASITYGSDSDRRTPSGGPGPGSSGTAIPWHRSLSFDGSADYYSLQAQLNGSGDIHCEIVVSGRRYPPLTVSRGHASGGHSICQARAAPSDPTGLVWQNEN